MVRYFTAYLATMVVFFAIDFIWLGSVAKGFYRGQIGPLLLDDFRVGYAAIFYLLYGVGIIVFAVRPGLESGSLLTTLGLGALFGFLAYATYDLTNLATLKGYSATVAFVDMAWGTLLTAVSATAGMLITRAIMG